MKPLSEDAGNSAGVNRRPFGRRFAMKVTAGLAAAATLLGGMAVGASSASAADAPSTSYDRTLGDAAFEAARTGNGLAKEMNYGAILHAWMWSFNTIKDHMKEIADAGYTSIQTSPISNIVGPNRGTQFTENWYYVYQPAGTSIGNAVVGSEADLKAMTAEAHKYGIRVIVDGVINHFTADWNGIEDSWRKSELFHTRSEGGCGDNGTSIDYGQRWQVTHCHLLGLWDLNTENQEVANRMQAFLKQAVADGVDGFRYDAAKHIELPNEFGTYSPYFDTILKNGAQYQYGEVLQGDNGLNAPAYPALFDKYSTNGGGNTGSKYGYTIRNAVQWKSLNAGNLGSLQGDGVKDNQLVTWVESHDTYANTDEHSSELSAWQIRMGWGVVGSRAGGAPLFFNRPVGSGGSNPRFAERSQLGDAGDDEWKHPEVKWVNKFRNAMEGNAEYLRNCQSDNCLMIERYKSDGDNGNDGMTVVNMDGDKNLAGLATTLDDGEYVDQVYGNTITVSGKKITSGTVNSGKIHVFYNARPAVVIPVTSLAITGATGGRVSMDLATTGTVQLGASVTPADATTAVTWTSSDESVAKVDATGKVTGVKAGTAVITAAADGRSASVTVTCTGERVTPTTTTIYYPANRFGADSTYLHWRYADGTWTTAPGDKMSAACDGYVSITIDNPDQKEIEFVFNDGDRGWDNRGDVSGQNYLATGEAVVITDNSGNYGTTAPCAVTVPVRSVSIAGGDLSLTVGDAKTLSATVAPANATDGKISWSSSNASVASVDADGTVTAKAAGTATITASAGGKSASVTVSVASTAVDPIRVESVSIPGGDFSLKLGGSRTISAVVLPANATDRKVSWSSSNASVASVDADGKVTAKAVGAAAIIASADGKTASVTVTVTDAVAPPVGDFRIVGPDTVGADDRFQLTVSGLSETVDDADIEWETSDFRVVSSNPWPADQGETSSWDASSVGTATVTATVGGKTASKTITVERRAYAYVSGLSLSGAGLQGSDGTYTLDVATGGRVTIDAATVPADAPYSVMWQTKDKSVARVDADGTIRGIAPGTTQIVAYAYWKRLPQTITVTVSGDGPVTVPVESVSVSGTGVSGGRASVKVGAGLALAATVNPSNATDKKVTWTSSDASVASVDADGAVRALAEGVATITAFAGGKSASVEVTVTKDDDVVLPEAIAIAGDGVSNGKLALDVNASKRLSVKATPADAALGAVAWSSSDTAVVVVDGTGNVTAKGEGLAVVTAAASGLHNSIVVTVTKAQGPVDRFVDVPSGVAFHDEIEWLAANKVSQGYGDGRFGYADSLSRQDMAIFLYRMAKLEGVPGAEAYEPSAAEYARFRDVSRDSFGAKEILWLASVGISQGNADGTFRGGDRLSRQDMAIFLYRFAKLAGSSSAAGFEPSDADYARFRDVSRGSFGAKEILWMASEGVTLGNPDGTFAGGQELTRSAMAAFLWRIDQHLNH